MRGIRAFDLVAAAALAAFMAGVSVVARVTQPEARPVNALGLALLALGLLALGSLPAARAMLVGLEAAGS